jgi:hypothetical protein
MHVMVRYFTLTLLFSILLPIHAIAAETRSSEVVTNDTEPPQSQESHDDEMDRLWREIEALKRRIPEPDSPPEVDLSDKTVPLETDEKLSVFARPWYDRFDLWGFGAAGLVSTGRDGARQRGSFLVTGSIVNIEAHAWEDISFLFELQANDPSKPDSFSIKHREVYAHFRNALKFWADDVLSIKIGYVDIPFGEEYLQQAAPDNPLITHASSFPYGLDEGIVLYGKVDELGWIFSVTDGSLVEGFDDHRLVGGLEIVVSL